MKFGYVLSFAVLFAWILSEVPAFALDVANVNCPANVYFDGSMQRALQGDATAAACVATAEIQNYNDETKTGSERRRLRQSAMRFYEMAKRGGISFRGIVTYGRTWDQLLRRGDSIASRSGGGGNTYTPPRCPAGLRFNGSYCVGW